MADPTNVEIRADLELTWVVSVVLVAGRPLYLIFSVELVNLFDVLSCGQEIP